MTNDQDAFARALIENARATAPAELADKLTGQVTVELEGSSRTVVVAE